MAHPSPPAAPRYLLAEPHHVVFRRRFRLAEPAARRGLDGRSSLRPVRAQSARQHAAAGRESLLARAFFRVRRGPASVSHLRLPDAGGQPPAAGRDSEQAGRVARGGFRCPTALAGELRPRAGARLEFHLQPDSERLLSADGVLPAVAVRRDGPPHIVDGPMGCLRAGPDGFGDQRGVSRAGRRLCVAVCAQALEEDYPHVRALRAGGVGAYPFRAAPGRRPVRSARGRPRFRYGVDLLDMGTGPVPLGLLWLGAWVVRRRAHGADNRGRGGLDCLEPAPP